MPCWSVTTNEVEIGKVDPTMASRAAVAAGYTVRASERGFVATGSGVTLTVGAAGTTLSTRLPQSEARRIANEFKRSYSAEVVKAASSRFGWRLTEKHADQRSNATLSWVAQRR